MTSMMNNLVVTNIKQLYSAMNSVNNLALSSGSSGSVENVPDTLVLRDSDGEINVGTLNSDSVNILEDGSLFLPTSGGSPSNLNYYEQHLFMMNFSLGGTSISNTDVSLIRCGRMVTMTVNGANRTATYSGNGYIIGGIESSIPERFRPIINEIIVGIMVINNGNDLPGFVTVSSDGSLLLKVNASANYYANSSYDTDNFYGGVGVNIGFHSFSMSWNIMAD